MLPGAIFFFLRGCGRYVHQYAWWRLAQWSQSNNPLRLSKPRQRSGVGHANTNLSVDLSRADADASGVEHGVASPGDHDAIFFGDLKTGTGCFSRNGLFVEEARLLAVRSSLSFSLSLSLSQCLFNPSMNRTGCR